MSAVVPNAPAAIIGTSPFLYFREYAVPKPIPAAQRRYCESRLTIEKQGENIVRRKWQLQNEDRTTWAQNSDA